MRRIDPEKERERLEKLYSGMYDAELEKVSGEWFTLTDAAKKALRAEMARRGMNVETIDKLEREGAGGPEQAPVVVRRFRDLPEAWVVQGMIESAGIESVLLDENIVALNWFWSNAVGGAKLQVRGRDAEDAVQLLKAEQLTEFDVPGLGIYQLPACPQCGSLDVTHDGLDRRLTYLLFFLRLPIPVKNRGWQCHACGHLWKGEKEKGSE